MDLECGIHGTCVRYHYTPGLLPNYTFIGTEERLENLDDKSKVIVKLRNRLNCWKNRADHDYEVKASPGTHAGADPWVCRDFVDMIQKGTRPLSTPLAGRMSVATACAASESIRNGRQVIDVPPVENDLRSFVF